MSTFFYISLYIMRLWKTLTAPWGEEEVAQYISFLATANVAANTMNQALNALVFHYKQVLYMELGIFPIFCKKESR